MNDLNVLVLEDEPFQRLVAVTALKKVVPGSILEAADGKEAVAILESCGHVDIAICDLQMSGMDGLAFLRHASLSGKVHSVILSSEVDPILRQATISMIECLGLNFLGDLGKPFSLERITALLTRYNARRQDLPRQIEVAELPSVADVVRGLDNGEFEAYYQPKVAPGWRRPDRRRGPGTLEPPASRRIAAVAFPLCDGNLQPGRQAVLATVQPGSGDAQEAGAVGAADQPGVQRPSFATGFACAGREHLGVADRVPPAAQFGDVRDHRDRVDQRSCQQPGEPRASADHGLRPGDGRFRRRLFVLDRLCEFPFSQIKLDRTFVQKMKTQPRSCAVISSVVALAQALGISLVVEGVESDEQRVRLIELGCSIAQGYLFARPMPEQHFLDYCSGS